MIGRIEGRVLTLFGAASVESNGIAKGIVTDLGGTSSAVKELVDRLEFQTKLRLEGALLAMNGPHLECVPLEGKELALERGREITSREVRRILQQAQSLSLPINRRLLHVLLQGYVVDGQGGIGNPLGMYGHHLGIQLKGVIGVDSFIQNAITSIHRAGLEVEGIVLSGYATALAALGREEKNFGSLFLEIGRDVSTLLAFQGGGVHYAKVFPIGGESITETIAKTFEISLPDAGLLKKQYGSLFLPEGAADHELLVDEGSRRKVVLRRELCEVTQKAVDTLFQTFQKDMKELSTTRSTLVLAGGGALLEGIVESAGNYFRLSSRLGKLQDIQATKPLSLPFATTLGLLWYGNEKQKEKKDLLPENPAKRALAKVKDILLDYF